MAPKYFQSQIVKRETQRKRKKLNHKNQWRIENQKQVTQIITKTQPSKLMYSLYSKERTIITILVYGTKHSKFPS